MHENRELSAVQEDYLEAILGLSRDKGAARVRDIAKALSVHKSTVTAALKALAGKGLINYSPYEFATLSEDGRRIADEVERRHRVIEGFLANVLLIGEEAARENACRMEHVMDRKILDRLITFAEFIESHPLADDTLPEHFAAHLKQMRGRSR